MRVCVRQGAELILSNCVNEAEEVGRTLLVSVLARKVRPKVTSFLSLVRFRLDPALFMLSVKR